MADTPVPALMPTTLPTRDTGSRTKLQVARPVRAATVADFELATAHLAGARMFQAPASARYHLVGSSGATFKRRIATPILPEFALIRVWLSSDEYRELDVRASSDTTGLTTWTDPTEVVLGGGDSAPFAAPVVVAIGAGSIESPGYEEVHLQLTNVSGGGSVVRMHSWSVYPLPHLSPDSDGVF